MDTTIKSKNHYDEGINVKLTLPIPFDKPDKNGITYTRKAVEDAVNHLNKNLPIVLNKTNGPHIDGIIFLGRTSGDSHIVNWDFDNQICNVTVEGTIFSGGAAIFVNSVENDIVTDFRITGIGFSLEPHMEEENINE